MTTARIGVRASIVLAAALALACGSDLLPGLELPVKPPPAVLENVVFEGYQAGSLQIQVRARLATIDAQTRRAELEQVRIDFDDPTDGPIQIRAERGQVDLEREDFILQGRVWGTIGEGQRFETAEVRYQADGERLWTDQPVTVTRGGMVLRGDGMEIDVPRQRIKIMGNVHTVLEGGS